MSKILKLSKNIIIGDDNKILLIPEIGINHFGSLEKAKKIVLSAKKAGAIAIKAQVHIPELEMSREAKKRNCLNLNDEKKLKQFIEDNNLLYIASCFCTEAADFLYSIGTKVFKIGSGECNHFPLLEKIAKFKLPIIVSTGMHSIKEIDTMIKFLQQKKAKFAINHCVNIYPTDLRFSNLHRLKYLVNKYSNIVPVGISDHAKGMAVCYASIPIGVSMIEKHYVENKKKDGPDISSSMNFDEFKELTDSVNDLKFSINKKLNVIKGELLTKNFALHSVVAKISLKKNERLTLKKITFKRPGTGDFTTKNFYNIIGKKVKKTVPKNSQIKSSHL
jgi:sialic acid synthase SpsE